MKKEAIRKFNKNYYLLGIRKDDKEKVWLRQGNWDCEWYWGIGYVEVFNENYTDINEHTHFDSLFFRGNKCCYDMFIDYFEKTVLTEKEIWKLLENMKTIYTLRNYSDLLHIGGSNITKNDLCDNIKNNEEYKRINNLLIPKLLDEIYKLLEDNLKNVDYYKEVR